VSDDDTPDADVVVVSWPRPEVALVTLNRPDKLNALTLEMADTIRATFAELGRNAECRVIVLTGAGRAFCAGLDLGGFVERTEADASGPVARYDLQERFAGMIRAARAVPQPVIAAVNGAAAGAGFALTLAADVRVASQSATFHVAAVKLGLSAGECGISYHLPRYVGTARAFEIMLTGRPFDAAEADRIGLVTRVVPDGEVIDAALETAEAITTNSPFGVTMTKKIMWSNLDATFDAAMELENRTQILAVFTHDSGEAIQAFLEKRPARYEGR
jgi:enoyl-CoA hydratase